VWISKRDGCSQSGIEPAWRDVRQDQLDIGVEGMNDFSVLKKLALDANEQFPALEDQWSMVCTPSVGLDLIAEIERLTQQNRLLTEHNEFLASSDSRLAPELRAVKDALGLDFTASVIGEVVPTIEKLHKDAERYRFLRNDLTQGGDIDFCIVRKHWKAPALESILSLANADEQIDSAMTK
jgi:hypothetical protein